MNLQKRQQRGKNLLVNKGKILLMDDDKVMLRDISGYMLNCLGYKVDFAKDVTQATTLYKKAKDSNQPFDAVILSLTAEDGMRAKKTIRELKEIDPEVKCIISSGCSSASVMVDFTKYGLSDTVARPYNLKEIGKILYEVINDKREIKP